MSPTNDSIYQFLVDQNDSVQSGTPDRIRTCISPLCTYCLEGSANTGALFTSGVEARIMALERPARIRKDTILRRHKDSATSVTHWAFLGTIEVSTEAIVTDQTMTVTIVTERCSPILVQDILLFIIIHCTAKMAEGRGVEPLDRSTQSPT